MPRSGPRVKKSDTAMSFCQFQRPIRSGVRNEKVVVRVSVNSTWRTVTQSGLSPPGRPVTLTVAVAVSASASETV